MLRVCTQKVTKDKDKGKDKEALFNVAYLKQIFISKIGILTSVDSDELVQPPFF